MPNTIIVCGYGVGISAAVAKKFGSEGFQVAIVARDASRLEGAAAALNESKIKARAFSADISEPPAVRKLIADVKAAFGSITVRHWNAHSHAAGDLLSATPDELRQGFDLSVSGLVVAVQEALPELRKATAP